MEYCAGPGIEIGHRDRNVLAWVVLWRRHVTEALDEGVGGTIAVRYRELLSRMIPVSGCCQHLDGAKLAWRQRNQRRRTLVVDVVPRIWRPEEKRHPVHDLSGAEQVCGIWVTASRGRSIRCDADRAKRRRKIHRDGRWHRRTSKDHPGGCAVVQIARRAVYCYDVRSLR